MLPFLTSCGEEEFIMTEQGTIKMPVKEGCVISEGHNKILRLTANYPYINVSSIFSLTSRAPEIAYVAQVRDLVEIPLETTEAFSSKAIIHNQGGYIVKMKLANPGTSSDSKCVVKLLIKEGPIYEGDTPDYLMIEYAIFRK